MLFSVFYSLNITSEGGTCSTNLELLIFVLRGSPLVPALCSLGCSVGMATMTIAVVTAKRKHNIKAFHGRFQKSFCAFVEAAISK